MTTPPQVPRTPDDVLDAVETALGCWPADSLLLVGLGPSRRVAAVFRVRVDRLLEGDPDDEELVRRVAAAADPCAADGARGAVVVLVTDRPGPHVRLLAAAAAAVRGADLRLADAALVRDGRWTSAGGSWACRAPVRRPGRSDGGERRTWDAGALSTAAAPTAADPAAADPGDAPGDWASAVAVLRGARTSSGELDAHVLPAWFDALDRVVARAAGAAVPGAAPHAGTTAPTAARAGAPAPAGALEAAAAEALDAPLAAWLLVGLEDPARRDAVLASVLPGGRAALTAVHPGPVRDRWGRAVTGVLDAGSAGAPAELDAAAALLRRLARLAPDGARADPLAVLAWWAWWRGRPEEAEALAAQALLARPGHGLAGLVLSCAEHRLVPAWARRTRPPSTPSPLGRDAPAAGSGAARRGARPSTR